MFRKHERRTAKNLIKKFKNVKHRKNNMSHKINYKNMVFKKKVFYQKASDTTLLSQIAESFWYINI